MARKRNSERQSIGNRLSGIRVIFCIIMIFVGIVQVARIKIVNGKEYEAEAITNQITRIQDIVINPNRGSILDRNKQGLAVSSTVFNVILDVRLLDSGRELEEEEKRSILSRGEEYKPEEMSEVYRTIKTLSDALGMTYEEVEGYTKKDEKGNLINDTNWYVLRKKVPYDVGRKLQEADLKYVFLEQDTKRNYPHGKFLSQVIGYMSSEYAWGLEGQYNEEMTGTPGRTFRTYDADSSFTTRQEKPKDGYTIITTIDQTIQQFAENITKKAYLDCGEEHRPERTSMVVMDPNTGEILAMAQYPDFDVNDPESFDGITKEDLDTVTAKDIKRLEEIYTKEKVDKMSAEEKLNTKRIMIKNDVWRNFNITDSFEPGSIYKPVVVAAALEENVIKTSDTFYCGGGRNVADRYIKCHYTPGHGSETLEEVLANSCNVGMMEIVEKLGKDKYYKYQQEFGIGEKTGVDLPDEKSMSALVYKYDNINEVELATCSFGQGFNCTPLQDITAFSALINGGNIMRPYIVSQVVDEKENVIREHEPEVVRKVISEDTSDFVRNALTKVFDEGGTGHKAAIEGYRLGGKTGTAEQGNREEGIHTVDFIAYFPVENPKYIAMAVIHRPSNYSDGVVSPAPMIKDLFQNIINYTALPPDADSDDINSNSEEIVNILDDYTGRSLKETINELIDLGLDVEIAGAGGDTVKKQFPEGNSKINETTKVIIYTEKQDQEIKLVKVPDVNGLTVDEAEKLLKDLGFGYVVQDDSEKEEVKEEEESSEIVDTEKNDDDKEKIQTNSDSKTIHEQTPQAGVELESGTVIKLKIK